MIDEITINQHVLINYNNNIDMVDAALFDYISYIYKLNQLDEDQEKELSIDGKVFVYIDLKMLKEEMPILKIKTKNALYEKLNRLNSLELIEIRQKEENVYVKPDPEIEYSLMFSE